MANRLRTTWPWLCAAAWLMTAAPALASANVSCLIDDAFLKFELEAIAGRAGPIVQVQVGAIEIKPAAAKLKTPQITFDRPQIIQQWMLGQEMRLQVEVTDEAANENVDLVIFTQFNERQSKYFGRYVLKISSAGKTKELKGRIKECEAG
ncbi:MAG: hypothetical protein WCI56_09345 [Hyphomicrobiales bacterium]